MTHWVLLRGLTREARHWGRFPELLATVPGISRVQTLDLPGNGGHYREKTPTDIASIVEDCRGQLAKQASGAPCGVLAMSLGAMVATEWMFRYPQEIGAAVLINTSMRPIGRIHERLRPRNVPALLHLSLQWNEAEAAERRVLSLTSTTQMENSALVEQWAAFRRECPVSRMNALRQLWAAARYRLPPGSPSAPVLILSSARDSLVDPQCSTRLAARWRAQQKVHAQAGHDLPLDDPEWVVARISEWLGLPAHFQASS